MTVGELLSRISSRELTEWMAFYRLEPWGAEVDDQRAALVAATVANTWRAKGPPAKVEDFMPRREPQPVQAQSWEDQVRILEAWWKGASAVRQGGGPY